MSVPIRVAVAEDHELVREGLKALFKGDPTIAVVAEAKTGIEAVDLVKKVKPDVLILDLRIPSLHGLEVLTKIKEETGTRVVVVTMHSEELYVLESFKNGAAGYVLKDSPPKTLKEAIQVVAAGGEFICAEMRQKTISAKLKEFPSKGVPDLLNARELSIIKYAAQGKTSQEIARVLSLGRRTTESLRARATKKLGLKTHTDLIMYALRNGLIN